MPDIIHIDRNTERHIVLMNPDSADLLIEQEAGSRLRLHIIVTEKEHSDNTIRVEHCGEGAETELLGLVIGKNKDDISIHTIVNHNVGKGKSNQLFKYVLSGEAKASFEGELVVKPDAQQTDAYQTNRNLLLSEKARMRTQPQLEIYADDVHCSHGASTGQLDENALFYMQQRGISLESAKNMLVEAFCKEILDTLPEKTDLQLGINNQ